MVATQWGMGRLLLTSVWRLGAAHVLPGRGQPLTTENHVAPNVSGVEAEAPWPNGSTSGAKGGEKGKGNETRGAESIPASAVLGWKRVGRPRRLRQAELPSPSPGPYGRVFWALLGLDLGVLGPWQDLQPPHGVEACQGPWVVAHGSEQATGAPRVQGQHPVHPTPHIGKGFRGPPYTSAWLNAWAG